MHHYQRLRDLREDKDLICDQDLRIKAILELDDNSHDTTSRKERDEFLNSILQNVCYTVLHTRAVTKSTLEGL